MPNTDSATGGILLYKNEDGSLALDVQLRQETVWLNMQQIAKLFGVDKSGASRHIRNILESRELPRKGTVAKIATVQTEGKRSIKRHVEYFNLDMILSVGYRVNSRRATQFRIWATTTLRRHLTEGFTLNSRLLKQHGIDDLSRIVRLIRSTMQERKLTGSEAEGLLRVITDYADTWLLLQQYDEESLKKPRAPQPQRFAMSYKNAEASVSALKKNLLRRRQASDTFGRERGNALKDIIDALEKGTKGQQTIDQKASHLLYAIICDRPFVDGNKRIAAFLFIVYLLRNNALTGRTGERKFSDNTLVALCLLIAQSTPKQKDAIMILIMNFVGGKV